MAFTAFSVTFIYTTPERQPTGMVIHHVRINASATRLTENSTASMGVAPLAENTDPTVSTPPMRTSDTRYVAIAPPPPAMIPVIEDDAGDNRQPTTPRKNAEGTTIGSARAGNKKLEIHSPLVPRPAETLSTIPNSTVAKTAAEAAAYPAPMSGRSALGRRPGPYCLQAVRSVIGGEGNIFGLQHNSRWSLRPHGASVANESVGEEPDNGRRNRTTIAARLPKL
ncbi:hypothetical protein SAMN05216564_11233 [Halopenitus persicus]|uniref:Uncharacterized protein n=1 Tax=Halopenitus persicus TaxID=1048396 RepID=A0A1H3NBA9_9EURY|nr:hypothetical protein SAMN05216564_11233 [Halopenitus persicus]